LSQISQSKGGEIGEQPRALLAIAQESNIRIFPHFSAVFFDQCRVKTRETRTLDAAIADPSIGSPVFFACSPRSVILRAGVPADARQASPVSRVSRNGDITFCDRWREETEHIRDVEARILSNANAESHSRERASDRSSRSIFSAFSAVPDLGFWFLFQTMHLISDGRRCVRATPFSRIYPAAFSFHGLVQRLTARTRD